MTDHDWMAAVRDDIRAVGKSVEGLGRELSAVHATVQSVARDVADHSAAITTIREAQLTCPARAREATTRVDTAAQRRSDAPSRSHRTSAAWLPLVAKVLPYILIAAVGLGAYLASGGDAEAMSRAIRAINDNTTRLSNKIESIERQTAAEEIHDVIDIATIHPAGR
jgi:hypothetical protein